MPAGRPKRIKKQPPITQEERDRLVAEFYAKGGQTNALSSSTMSGTLKADRKTGVAAQMPWVNETYTATKNEDIDLME